MHIRQFEVIPDISVIMHLCFVLEATRSQCPNEVDPGREAGKTRKRKIPPGHRFVYRQDNCGDIKVFFFFKKKGGLTCKT